MSGESASLPDSAWTSEAADQHLVGRQPDRALHVRQPGRVGVLVELGDDPGEDLVLGLVGTHEVGVGPRETFE